MTIKAQLLAGPRGSRLYYPVTMEEALRTATMWLSIIRSENARQLAMTVGHNNDFALASHWTRTFGSTKVFPDNALVSASAPAPRQKNKTTSLMIAFGSGLGRGGKGVQQHIARSKADGAKLVSINPVKTGLSSLADIWLAIRPGCDAKLLQALTTGKHDRDIGISKTEFKNLVALLREHSGSTTIVTGRGTSFHANANHFAQQLSKLDADILPARDHIGQTRNLSDLTGTKFKALITINSNLPTNVFPTYKAADAALTAPGPAHIIAFQDQPDDKISFADLIIYGDPHQNLLTLAARLGMQGFSTPEGESLFDNGYKDYTAPPLPKAKPLRKPVDATGQEPDETLPFHAISIKPHEGANRALAFMHPDKATQLGLKTKQPIWVKTNTTKTRAILATMPDMNPDTVWTWGKAIFEKLTPATPPLQNPTTAQPAWFDLKVGVEAADD